MTHLEDVFCNRRLNLKLMVPFNSMFSCYETPWHNMGLNVSYFPDFLLSVNFPYFQAFLTIVKFSCCTTAHQIQRDDMNAQISSFMYFCDNRHIIYCCDT